MSLKNVQHALNKYGKHRRDELLEKAATAVRNYSTAHHGNSYGSEDGRFFFEYPIDDRKIDQECKQRRFSLQDVTGTTRFDRSETHLMKSRIEQQVLKPLNAYIDFVVHRELVNDKIRSVQIQRGRELIGKELGEIRESVPNIHFEVATKNGNFFVRTPPVGPHEPDGIERNAVDLMDKAMKALEREANRCKVPSTSPQR